MIEAAGTRLRPILMTTAATVVGHLPLVFASGPGAGARNSIGIMLVSGMIIGTVVHAVRRAVDLHAGRAQAAGGGGRRSRGAHGGPPRAGSCRQLIPPQKRVDRHRCQPKEVV